MLKLNLYWTIDPNIADYKTTKTQSLFEFSVRLGKIIAHSSIKLDKTEGFKLF